MEPQQASRPRPLSREAVLLDAASLTNQGNAIDILPLSLAGLTVLREPLHALVEQLRQQVPGCSTIQRTLADVPILGSTIGEIMVGGTSEGPASTRHPLRHRTTQAFGAKVAKQTRMGAGAVPRSLSSAGQRQSRASAEAAHHMVLLPPRNRRSQTSPVPQQERGTSPCVVVPPTFTTGSSRHSKPVPTAHRTKMAFLFDDDSDDSVVQESGAGSSPGREDSAVNGLDLLGHLNDSTFTAMRPQDPSSEESREPTKRRRLASATTRNEFTDPAVSEQVQPVRELSRGKKRRANGAVLDSSEIPVKAVPLARSVVCVCVCV